MMGMTKQVQINIVHNIASEPSRSSAAPIDFRRACAPRLVIQIQQSRSKLQDRLAKKKTKTVQLTRHHPLRFHVGRIELSVFAQVRWLNGQKLLFPVHQSPSVERRQLKSVPMCNRVGRASFYTISAKNAAVVVDIVDGGIALGAADPLFGGVLGSFDVNAIRGAGGRAKEASHALFQAILVALEHVHAAKSLLELGA